MVDVSLKLTEKLNSSYNGPDPEIGEIKFEVDHNAKDVIMSISNNGGMKWLVNKKDLEIILKIIGGLND